LRAARQLLEPIVSVPREADGYRLAASHVYIVHQGTAGV
jgi:hypothetical protein